jgi:hypothetical protein
MIKKMLIEIGSAIAMVSVCSAQQAPMGWTESRVTAQVPKDPSNYEDSFYLIQKQLQDLLQKQTDAINSLATRLEKLENRVSALEGHQEAQ